MADIVDQTTRSRMMAGIRSVDTRPELAVRKALFAKGFRYRLHPRNVPGKPDIAFPRYHAALFVNGCFWHGHDCRLFRLPGTRSEFWAAKIQRNRERDAAVRQQLQAQGWRVLTIWECAIRGRDAHALPCVIGEAAKWLTSADTVRDIRGGANGAR